MDATSAELMYGNDSSVILNGFNLFLSILLWKRVHDFPLPVQSQAPHARTRTKLGLV
jgi:hypothetical protein